jgi:cytidylate kinase
MHVWVLGQQMAGEHAGSHRFDGPHRRRLRPVIAVSREAGAGGGEIARLAAQSLGWELLDANLLDRVADRYHLARPMLELVDETRMNWMYDVFGPWFDRRIIPHEKYVARLTRVVRAAALRGNVVLVGRGAQFMLPRGEVLAVRVVAPLPWRVQRVAQLFAITETVARRWISEIDRGRGEFARRFFHQDVANPCLYNVVYNVASLSDLAEAAQDIVSLYRRLEETEALAAAAHN